ncbi:glycosyltransferase family 2 protein [Candidatus Saccharibacteria bacterium]|nr:glycosyltransferase family 2 protein [Candidatus Saccharibacteria bacterium]
MFNRSVNIAAISKRTKAKKLALLLPAHNEELIIQATIKSAIASGQSPHDIFVVDDCSSDNTRQKALQLLPLSNVLTVQRSGKARAVMLAILHFNITVRYGWLHIADADSVFGRDYFRIFRKNLSPRYIAAIGFVQSMKGNWISKYRVYEYTYGQNITRRIQSWLHMITVLPGPVTCLRTDILERLDFTAESLTEDFDITLQIHRAKLGRIKFIREAINYTQDPRTYRDFVKQNERWFRGYFQGIRRHKIGTRLQRIDLGIGYQLFEMTLYSFQLFVIYPVILVANFSLQTFLGLLIGDAVIFFSLVFVSAMYARRPSVLFAFPSFYILRTAQLFIYLKAFIEVILLRQYQGQTIGWETAGRRYQLSQKALSEMAV